MKTKTKVILGVVGLVGVCVVVGSHHARTIDERDVITGEIVVDFKDNTSPEKIDALGKKLGVEFKPASSYSSVDKMYVAEGVENEDEVLDELRGNSDIEAADKDEVYSIPENN
jgi:hypothetical protein